MAQIEFPRLVNLPPAPGMSVVVRRHGEKWAESVQVSCNEFGVVRWEVELFRDSRTQRYAFEASADGSSIRLIEREPLIDATRRRHTDEALEHARRIIAQASGSAQPAGVPA